MVCHRLRTWVAPPEERVMKWGRQILHKAQSVVLAPSNNEHPLASPVSNFSIPLAALLYKIDRNPVGARSFAYLIIYPLELSLIFTY